MRIAIQGAPGAFHEFAAQQWFGAGPIEFVYCQTFREVFMALEAGRADQAVTAIENSLYGSINEVYDLLQKHRFSITGEVMLHIHQQLIGLPDAELRDVTAVYSQDVALAQCEVFLDKSLPDAKCIKYHDTAASALHVKTENNPHYAAIAGRSCAHQYGLAILAENIEDNPQNYTRFVVLDKTSAPDPKANKASLILETDHTPGALHRALGVFARHDVNLTTMHSRPIPQKAWRHMFYLDVDVVGSTLVKAIATLKEQGATVTVLGQYPRATTIHET